MKQSAAKIVASRLITIEGQVRGLISMIESDRTSEAVLLQILAIRGAIGSVGVLVIGEHIDELVGTEDMPKKAREHLSALMKSFLT